MKPLANAATPEGYLAALGGWQRGAVQALHGAVTEAALALHETTPLERAMVMQLVREAVALNAALGDPTRLSRSPR